MILLDAYALVALLGDEPAAAQVEELLRRDECGASVVNVAEAIDVCCRVHDLQLAEVRTALGGLILGGRLHVRAPSEETAWRAATLRQTHYAKKTCEISMADCFLVAAAASGDEIATADGPVAQIARSEGIEVIPLPNSSGTRP